MTKTFPSDRQRTVVLKLPYPPSINAYWLASGHRRYISARGIAFKTAVRHYVGEFRTEGFGALLLEMTIIIYPRSKKLMDIDNCVKPILDACQDAGLFNNDVQVTELHVFRGSPKKGGGCCVMISELPTSSNVNPQG